MFKFIIVVIIFVIIVNIFNKAADTITALVKSMEEYGFITTIIGLCVAGGVFYYIYTSFSFKPPRKETIIQQPVQTNTVNPLDKYSLDIAAISNGYFVSNDHPDAVRSRYLLGKVAKHFKTPPGRISDITVAASQQLSNSGIKKTPLEVLEDMNTLLADTPRSISYEEIVAAYLTLAIN